MALNDLFKPKPPSQEDKLKAAQAKKEQIKKSAERPAKLRTPLPVGTMVDRYKMGKLIGMGSFSLVYQALDTESKEYVVIKEYYPKYYSKRVDDKVTILPFEGRKLITYNEGFKQFFSEALALHKINHPNVLKAHNMFRANRTAYMVSDNETGRDLKWFLNTTDEALKKDLLYKIFLP
ncbi:MAG: serine/threonine protein kinase, partial [Neolewinella sp.]